MSHHKTWFPVIVLALSLLLGLFIYSVFKERIATSSEPITPVTAVEYQARVHAEVSGLAEKLTVQSSDSDCVRELTQTRDALLNLLVPAELKDAHLEMVMTLTQWIAGYEGQIEKIALAEARWRALVDQYPWIE